MRFAFEV